MRGVDPLVVQLLLQATLILLNAVFACAEIALLSVNQIKLEKLAAEGSRKARRLLSLTAYPAKFLAAIQVGITLAGFLGSAFAADSFAGKLTAVLASSAAPVSEAAINTVSLVLITLILSFFTLVLGELVPKRIAMHKAQSIALTLSPLIAFAAAFFAPVVWLLSKATNILLRVFGIDPEASDGAVTEEEIRLLIDSGSAKGSIAAREQEIIHNVFEFDDKTAEDVMTHRRDTVFLKTKDSDETWEKIILETKHARYPVCGEDADDIRGVLVAREYLGLKDRSRGQVMTNALRPAQLVPGTAATTQLFNRMKTRRNHFAVVVDEYGGMDGIVTMNDLLEELVGDFEDGAAKAEPVKAIGEGLWQVSGSASLERLARETGAVLPVDACGTFAGYVFTLLGRVPADGETPELEDAGLKISVHEIKDRRLHSALVRRIRQEK